jgi:hypothetical protein
MVKVDPGFCCAQKIPPGFSKVWLPDEDNRLWYPLSGSLERQRQLAKIVRMLPQPLPLSPNNPIPYSSTLGYLQWITSFWRGGYPFCSVENINLRIKVAIPIGSSM